MTPLCPNCGMPYQGVTRGPLGLIYAHPGGLVCYLDVAPDDSDAYQGLVVEVGKDHADEIINAAAYVIRGLKSEPHGSGQGHIRILVGQRRVLKIYRVVELEQRRC